jgi:hypothetical protein
MKKFVMIGVVVILALAAFGVGSVLAQGQQPPVGGMMGGRGMGWMHDYVEEALAAKLGLTEQQVEEAFASGKNLYQIALDGGIAEADIPALLKEVHQAAFDKAVKDGVLTQAQADWMLQRMQGNWSGGLNGNCPMHNGGYGPNNGAGFRGGMMGRR